MSRVLRGVRRIFGLFRVCFKFFGVNDSFGGFVVSFGGKCYVGEELIFFGFFLRGELE